MRTPLTDEQNHDLWRAIWEWIRIRNEVARSRGESATLATPALVDIEKSTLLGRMTLQGKDPLPFPPPTFNAACWYELIETGRADVSGGAELPMVYGPVERDDGTLFVIGGCRWPVVRDLIDVDLKPTSRIWVLSWPNYGEWLLRHRTPEDPPAIKGRRLIKGSVMQGGGAEDWYFDTNDWVLERMADQ